MADGAPLVFVSQERNLAFLDEQAESVREQEQKAFDRNAKYVRTHAVQKIQARFRLWWPARMAVSLLPRPVAPVATAC